MRKILRGERERLKSSKKILRHPWMASNHYLNLIKTTVKKGFGLILAFIFFILLEK